MPEKCVTMKESESYTERSSRPSEPLGPAAQGSYQSSPGFDSKQWYVFFPSFTLDWSRVSDVLPRDWPLSLSQGSPACSGGPKAPLVSCLRAPTEGAFPPARAIYRTSWCFCQTELQQSLPETEQCRRMEPTLQETAGFPPVHCRLPVTPCAGLSEVACQPCGPVTLPPCRWIFFPEVRGAFQCLDSPLPHQLLPAWAQGHTEIPSCPDRAHRQCSGYAFIPQTDSRVSRGKELTRVTKAMIS